MLLQLLLTVTAYLLYVNAKLCGDVSVRNDHLLLEEHLRACSVIAGNLEITLFKPIPGNDFSKISFPELTEIRGYLLVYRIYGLTTLADIIPNLKIIRGLKLFQGYYAIVLYDLRHLKELGLHKLTHIQRGSTKIENCPDLCYVNTLNWILIGGPSHKLDYINSNENICPKCPESCNGLCWNERYCQQPTRNDCHPECLGCTEPNSSEKCIDCRYYKDEETCVSKCSEGKFKHVLTVSCLTHYDCITNGLHGLWWPFQGECVDRCPPQHRFQNFDCIFCEKPCENTCNGIKINRLLSSASLYGCTHINGSLVIRVNSVSQIEDLYRDLEMIEEIQGYLKVHNSRVLTSLKFLKNLKVIRGLSELYNGKHALIVYENPHLRKLWDHNQIVQVKNGAFYFHDNTLLCLTEIEKIANMAKLNITTDCNVSPISNGENSACNQIELNINVTIVDSTIAKFQWENIAGTKIGSPPIAYQLLYTENRWENINSYIDEQPYYENIWKSVFVNDTNTYQIVDLLPLTEYTYYMRVCTNSLNKDAQTTLKYFKTPLFNPPKIRNFKAISTTSNSVTLNWEFSKLLYGILDRYKIVINYKKIHEAILKEKNFCRPRYFDNLMVSNLSQAVSSSGSYNFLPTITKKKSSQFTCKRLIMTGDPKYITCKNHIFPEDATIVETTAYKILSNSVFPRPNPSKLIEIPIKDSSTNSYTIKHLKYFSKFAFLLKICHKERINECSLPVMVFQKTLPKIDADDIPPGIFINVMFSVISMKWSEPRQPNSMIQAYDIEYKQADEENSLATIKCVTRNKFVKSNHKFKIENIPEGHYLIRVRAVSLAGPGRFSPYKSFKIPSFTKSLFAMILVGFLIGAIMSEMLQCVQNKRLKNFIIVPLLEVRKRKPIYLGTFITLYLADYKEKKSCILQTLTTTNPGRETVFKNRADILKHHEKPKFVLELIGLFSDGQRPYVVIEKPAAILKAYLTHLRHKGYYLRPDKMSIMAAEIADGMAFLSSKGIVHEDLAARNIAIASNGSLKIGDLSISESLYQDDYWTILPQNYNCPLRWMAPESLQGSASQRTTKSNVWSYGIVLMEIATRAKMPFATETDEAVFNYLSMGGIPKYSASITTFFLKEIMVQCWKQDPNLRVSFKSILQQFAKLTNPNFRRQSYYFGTLEGRIFLRSKNLSR